MFRNSVTLLSNLVGKANLKPVYTRSMASLSDYTFQALKVTSPSEFVYHIEINRPEKRNAMNKAFWEEMVVCFNKIAVDPDCRAVVFSGAGKIFTAGIDLQTVTSDLVPDPELDLSRKAFALRNTIAKFQESFTVIEKCPKPVIAAIHSACIGGGVDLICACDIRYCTNDAWFQVKEVDLGIVADVGTLQRFPKIVGNESLVRELCFTGREFKADEAKSFGLVSKVYPDRDAMIADALRVAGEIASKSPVTVQGIKETLVYARDHSVDESLQQVRTLNQVLLQGEDTVKAVTSMLTKEKPTFSKL